MSAFLYIMRYRHRSASLSFLVVAVLVIVTLVIVSGGHLYIILSLNDVTKCRDVTGCPIYLQQTRALLTE